MTPLNLEALAAETARAAGEYARSLAERAGTDFTSKQDGSIVTFADPLVEEFIKRRLADACPDAAFMGEETGGVPQGVCWVVDPIDGTSNFAAGLPFWCVSIGLLADGFPVAGAVHDPSLGETFSAARGYGARLNGRGLLAGKHGTGSGFAACIGFPRPRNGGTGRAAGMLERVHAHGGAIRSQGAGALSTCYVAAGRQGLFAEAGIHLWDVAAAQLVVAESGGSVHSAWSREQPSEGFAFVAFREGLQAVAEDVLSACAAVGEAERAGQ